MIILYKEIIENYYITNHTIALFPSYQHDSSTLAIELDQEYRINQSPLSIIKENCIHGYSSYEGRRKAAGKIIKGKNKLPIAVYPQGGIYAIPTHSPWNYNCHWLFFTHIHDILASATKQKQSIVTFSNSYKIDVPVSSESLNKQWERTSLYALRHDTYWDSLRRTPTSPNNHIH